MRKGLCTNFDKPCPRHVHEEIIEVPEGADFVCPECSRELMAPSGGSSMSERIVAIASDRKIRVAGTAAIVLLGIVVWMLTGSGVESSDTSTEEIVADMSNRPDQEPACGVEGTVVKVQVEPNFAADVRGERVVVQFAVDREGNVVEPRATSSESRLLGEEAVDAVRKLDCKPGMRGGQLAKMRTELPVVFQREEPQITRKPDCGVRGTVQHQVKSDFAADVRGERVVVQFAVDREGNVVEPRATSSESRLLGEEAVDAVRKLDCKPGMRGGQLAKMRTELPVVFQREEPQITRKADCGGTEAVQNQADYPDFAEKTRIEGRVVVEFSVDKNGGVVNPSVIDGSKNQLLRRAALNAVNKLSCKSAMENGKPVTMEMKIPVVFDLDDM